MAAGTPASCKSAVAALAETLPGVYADTWMGVAAPPSTPKEVTNTISNAIGQAFKQPELRVRIIALEANPLGSTPDEMRELIRQSLAHWGNRSSKRQRSRWSSKT